MTQFMDYELLALMLKNYKRLYIADGRRVGDKEDWLQHIVTHDIEPAIAWAERRAEYDAELTARFDYDADAGLNDADNNDL
jgi:hypothetical protein